MVRLSGPEAHQLLHVLRVTPGTVVTCFDGNGQEADGTVQRVARREVLLELGQARTMPGPRCWITLGIAVPRHAKFEQIIDQATQLGVSRIIPLSTQRGVVKISREASAQKQIRWSHVAVAAGKQSGTSRLPVVDPMTSWVEFLQLFSEFDRVLIAALEGPYSNLQTLLSGKEGRSVLLLIGPEGDFTSEEIREAVQAGARRVWLGPTVLRCETAVVAGLTLVSYFLNLRSTTQR